MNEENNIKNELVKLPLWRSALEELQANGIEYGQVIQSEWFEQRLHCTRDTMRFGLDISNIRRALESSGFYLSGRGQNSNQFIIVQPENNADVMQSYQRAAIDALKRGVILGTNTRLDLLKAEDRRRHESILEKLALKSVLLARSKTIGKLLNVKAPKLLAMHER